MLVLNMEACFLQGVRLTVVLRLAMVYHKQAVSFVKTERSDLLVLLEELFEGFLVQSVVHIRVPLKSGLEESSVSPAGSGGVLLEAHVVVRQSWELASLPAEVTLVP